MYQRLIFLGAEVLAVAVLHLLFVLRRDKSLPKGSKVPWIRGIPVLKNPFMRRKIEQPQPFSIEGWTPPPRRPKMPDPAE